MRTSTGLVLGLLAACSGPLEIRELRGPTMGSRYIVKYVGGPDAALVHACVRRVLDEYDRTFSLWRADSEISAVNRDRGREPLPLSEAFRAVLELALAVARRSGGAFDPTVRPLTALWQRERAGGEPATSVEREAALARVGWRRLQLTGAGLAHGDQELDLDGLVAGACADEMARQLQALGVSAAMLDITGEVLCFGSKPDGTPWEIGIVGPEGVVSTVALHDQSLCSSGTRENSIERDGVRRHHVFDARTGDNAEHRVVGVTVRARSCALADALDTALLVLGPDGAAGLLQGWPGEPGLGAVFLVQGTDGTLSRSEVRWGP